MNKLYIFTLYEDGTPCIQMIAESEFDDWFKSTTEDVREDCYPKFIDHFPTHKDGPEAHFILRGEIVVPMPMEVVKSYRLP